MVIFNHSCGIFRPAKERSKDDILESKNDRYLFIALPEKVPECILNFTNYSIEGVTSLIIEMQLPQGEGKELFNSVQKYFNTSGEKMNNAIIN